MILCLFNGLKVSLHFKNGKWILRGPLNPNWHIPAWLKDSDENNVRLNWKKNTTRKNEWNYMYRQVQQTTSKCEVKLIVINCKLIWIKKPDYFNKGLFYILALHRPTIVNCFCKTFRSTLKRILKANFLPRLYYHCFWYLCYCFTKKVSVFLLEGGPKINTHYLSLSVFQSNF